MGKELDSTVLNDAKKNDSPILNRIQFLTLLLTAIMILDCPDTRVFKSYRTRVSLCSGQATCAASSIPIVLLTVGTQCPQMTLLAS